MGFLDDLAKLVQDPEVRRLAERRARSHELAEDALQETFRAVAQMQNPETVRDLRAFFCKALIHEINHQLARSAPILTEDISVISDRRQAGTSSSGTSPPASAATEAHLRLLAGAALTRLERDRDELMAFVPARSSDSRRYRSAIIAAARPILRLLFEGHVTSADWNAVLKSEYPQWFGEAGLARDAIDQRLSRARGDVQLLLQAIFPRDQLASAG
jgi:DNA-directed RNA polymerase specialized sigma24 family protein